MILAGQRRSRGREGEGSSQGRLTQEVPAPADPNLTCAEEDRNAPESATEARSGAEPVWSELR